MSLEITSSFAATKELGGYKPVFLVELLGLGKFYATREPEFSGLWLANQGLLADSGILADADVPEYITNIYPLRSSGIGSISYQLDSSGFARTGSASVSFLNQDLLSHELQELVLNNTVARIRLGFFGQDMADYVSIFRGNVDGHQATSETLDLDLIDDTLRQSVPTPPLVGTDFLARSFVQGNAIPIILGDVENVPAIQLIGAATDDLAFEATPASTFILTLNPNLNIPNSGELRVTSSSGVSTVDYEGVSVSVINNVAYTRIDLAESLAFTHPSGSDVVLFEPTYTYMFGFAVQNVRKVRRTAGHPTVVPTVRNTPVEPTGLDHRRITIAEFENAEQVGVNATVSSEARGVNVFPNGNQDTNVADDLTAEGWTIGNGAWDRFLPASTFDYVLRGRTNVDQAVVSDAYIDIPTTSGTRYRFTFTIKNIDALYGQVAIGTPSAAGHYYTFEELTRTSESLYDLSFVADDTTLRITLKVGNFTPPHAATTVYFDQFDLYDLSTENPAVQLEHLILTHMPNITPHAASFAESEALWASTGDRCAGIIQQPEEDQALLGRLAQQFRAKTFLNENGEQKIVAFDQSRIPVYNFEARHVHKGTMTITRSPLTEIFTHFYVYYGRAPQDQADNTADLGGREAFQGVSFCTPFETNHSVESGLYVLAERAKQSYRLERTLEVFGDFIPDAKTAENLLSYIVRRGTHQRYICSFSSFLNAADVEVTDFVRITHRLVHPDHRGNTFEVVHKTVEANGCFTRFVCEEINPFNFGGYTEHWEPPVGLISSVIHHEAWDLPPPLAAFDRRCNPHAENWEPIILRYTLEIS